MKTFQDKIYKHEDLEIENELFYEMKSQKLANGILKNYLETGALCMEIPFKDGKKEGVEKQYYESGALRETPYKNGKVNGTMIIYYKSGEIKKFEIKCLNGKALTGVWYYENGSTINSTYNTDFNDLFKK